MNQADPYKEARKAVSLGVFHGGMVIKRKEEAHQWFGTNWSKISSICLYRRGIIKSYSPANQQYKSNKLTNKNDGHPQHGIKVKVSN